MTPFRHNFIKLRVKAPIFLAAQLKKHQAGLSWNEVSRRYVSTEPEFYVPEVWRSRPEGSVKQGSGSEPMDSEYWHGHYTNYLSKCQSMYNSMLHDDMAPEMARMVLPQSMMTEWIWSGNLLAFAHMYKERIASGAQQEAQEFAQQLNEAIGDLAPVSWKALTNG
jgi:thymidylate synthase (FAD)